MKLLIVNDIVIEAKTMAKDISWSNIGIETVYTSFCASDAKNIIEDIPIDILLTDIEMPDENGLSLIHWIQNRNLDIDCVLLTCHADFEYAREGLSLGCQDYITLPASYDDIAASVRKVVCRRQKRMEEKRLQIYGKNWLANQSKATHNENENSNAHYSSEEITEKCIQYIINHISDSNLSVTEIANAIYLNAIYLNRVFKKQTGINISQWIIKERMELASTLMLTTSKTAVEIAEQVGYSNYPYFSTVFKKYFNMTPSQFIKEKK